MIDLQGMISIPLLKKSGFTGSVAGKFRYRLEKATVEDGETLKATCWERDCCFDVSREEERTSSYFPFTREGIDEAVAWLNKLAEEIQKP